jgi:hypothetical protein
MGSVLLHNVPTDAGLYRYLPVGYFYFGWAAAILGGFSLVAN